MNKQFNYPIKVLKRKFNQKGYKPFIVDCSTGQRLKVPTDKLEPFLFFIMQLLFIVVAFGLVYFVIAQPVLETSQSKSAVNDAIGAMSLDDSKALQKLMNTGTVVSETTNDNIVSITIDVDRGQFNQAFKQAFNVSTVKEVYTDGEIIVVTFLSSE